MGKFSLTRLDPNPQECVVVGHATDADIVTSGVRQIAGNTEEVAVAAEMLVRTGASEAGSEQEGVVEVQEPGFFGNRTRIAARTLSRTHVWVKGRR